MRVRAVFFLVFFVSPGGPKGPKSFQKTPGPHKVNAPGRLFSPANRSVSGGVYSPSYGMCAHAGVMLVVLRVSVRTVWYGVFLG